MTTLGSPPQVRGKPLRHVRTIPATRITPAGAGKTYCPYLSPWAAQDHPRRCGENGGHVATVRDGVGSPPRMRGKHKLGLLSNKWRGITPADAGKTFRRELQENPCEDHPRGCGENNLKKNVTHLWRGSPPRMRGKHGFGDVWVRIPRITPADAGKTISTKTRFMFARDHPRGCGENKG